LISQTARRSFAARAFLGARLDVCRKPSDQKKEISAKLLSLNEGDPMNTSATADDDLQAIRKLGEEFFAAVAAADLDRRMATMDPGAVIMPPDHPPIVGKEEIRRLSHDYSAVFQEQCSVIYDEVETVGDWGFVRATVTGTRTYKSGGGVENVSLKNLWIVKRQADGQWKYWRIMFNNTPLAVASGR
jgi:uncharacterized protein (TIGR02246 family)